MRRVENNGLGDNHGRLLKFKQQVTGWEMNYKALLFYRIKRQKEERSSIPIVI